jgi:16S rRNA (uracil1498-N3)-methyltransferase
MSRRRFFIPPGCIHDGSALLRPDEAHHLRRVLRLKAGDAVELFDGQGNGFSGIVDYREDRVWVTRLVPLDAVAGRQPRLILAQSLLKSDRFEWVLQKATELGMDEIVPLHTQYCDVRLHPEKLDSRLERWNRIVREASKQCRRWTIPSVHRPEEFDHFLESPCPSDYTRLLFYENAEDSWEKPAAPSSGTILCIGPEGGWQEEEIRAAGASGYRIFNLGPRILRAETAAIAAMVLAQNW